MAKDNAPHDRYADPRAVELITTMKALEGSEKLVGIGQVETGAVVADVVDDLSGFFDPDEFDSRVVALRRELSGIADEVLDRHA